MIFALCGALAIGLSLGLLGSGGSILTVPILVFVMQRPDKLAVAESLAIVGSVALAGAIPYAVRGQIHWKTVLIFGLSGVLGSYAGACIAHYLSGRTQLILFGTVMIVAAAMMVKDRKWIESTSHVQHPIWLIMLEGFLIGSLTGCIGVGGGFIIVPALVLLVNLPMYLAIGTSLTIIAMNSFTGFVKQFLSLQQSDMQVSWAVIAIFSAIGIVGSLAGGLLARKIPQPRLRKMFGYLMFPLSLYILASAILSEIHQNKPLEHPSLNHIKTASMNDPTNDW